MTYDRKPRVRRGGRDIIEYLAVVNEVKKDLSRGPRILDGRLGVVLVVNVDGNVLGSRLNEQDQDGSKRWGGGRTFVSCPDLCNLQGSGSGSGHCGFI